MSVKLVPEEHLREALRPHRVDVNGFEAGIRARIEACAESRVDKGPEEQSPRLRVAAAFLPWPLIVAGKVAAGGGKLSFTGLGQQLLAYAALPAISLFLLAGAAFSSAAKIRSVQKDNRPDIGNEKEMCEAVRQWWGRHKWGAVAVFAAILILPMIGSTWLLFLLLLASFGSLLCLLSGLARLGVGNRFVIGQSCFVGLALLGVAMLNPFVGRRDIHLVDQTLITVVLFVGTLILVPFVVSSMKRLGIPGPSIEMEGKVSTWLFLLCGLAVADVLLLLLLNRSADNQPPVASGYRWLLLGTGVVVQVVFLIALSVGRFRKAVASRFAAGRQWTWGLLYVSVIVPLLAWFTNPILWPAAPARIQHHVESFEQGRYSNIAWRDWEITATWTIEAGLNPDLSPAQRLLDDEISDDQLLPSLVLGSAFRVGLVRPGQIERLAALERLSGFEVMRRSLIPEHRSGEPRPFTSLNQYAWVIHVLNQSAQLSSEDRDFLEQRLLATFDGLDDATANVLETALRVTQLLDVIDRPVDRDQYRERVHQLLCGRHSRRTHGFQIAGGFQQHKGLSSSLQATSHAVELMKIYGIPDELDLNWVRSYLRPLHYRPSNDKWIAAVTLDRLSRLPGLTQPTGLEILYYERSLITAMVLVALCIHATLSSPRPVAVARVDPVFRAQGDQAGRE